MDERNIIAILDNFYASSPKGISAVGALAAVKNVYGKDFRFESLGLGEWSSWLCEYKMVTRSLRDMRFTDLPAVEGDILDEIHDFFAKSPKYSYRVHVEPYLCNKYKVKAFTDFGFGSFSDFMFRHNIDLGK